jgi:hypothetical protein
MLHVAQSTGAAVLSYRHPGPSVDDHPLYADVVRVGSHRARRILLMISGTHGVEGFAGSAIQIACLRHLETAPLDSDTALILIHALNPYGFAWCRRVDEDNVDVNRNLVDHSRPMARNDEYESLHAALCPADWTEDARSDGARAVREYLERHGPTELANVLARGQHDHPDGLFFGGRSPGWSNRLLRSILDSLLEDAARVILLDIHTGLGSYGGSQLICGVDEDSPRATAVRRWLGDGAVFFGPTSGFERFAGAIDSVSEAALVGVDLTAVTVEFGTLPPFDVLHALRADNWLHRASARPSLDDPIKHAMRRAFAPEDPDWRELVLLRGRQIVARALDGLHA